MLTSSIDASCPRCLFCTTRCLCGHLPLHKFSSNLRIIVIQDHAECKPSKQVLSSIPILSLLLENVEVVMCAAGSFQVDVDLSAYNTLTDVALLYPSAASVPISDITLANAAVKFESQDSSAYSLKVLIVLDGSWVTVQHILARNSFLHPSKCRHVRLPSSDKITASVYHTSGLRREPAGTFVSTAEAVAWAMHFLSEELRPATREMLRLFGIFVTLKIASDKSIATNKKIDLEKYDTEHESESGSEDGDCSIDGSEYKTAGANAAAVSLLLLPSCGVKFKPPMSKAEKRKRVRSKERKRKR